jgi:hypothetical protein
MKRDYAKIGRKGGRSKSAAKAEAARLNGRKGGAKATCACMKCKKCKMRLYMRERRKQR